MCGREKEEAEMTARFTTFHCTMWLPWLERRSGQEVGEFMTAVPQCRCGGATNVGNAAAINTSTLSTVLSQ